MNKRSGWLYRCVEEIREKTHDWTTQVCQVERGE